MIIASVALAALTVFLVLFHSYRRIIPRSLFGVSISLMGAALSFGFCLSSNLAPLEISGAVISLVVTLFGSLLLMQRSLASTPEPKPIKVEND